MVQEFQVLRCFSCQTFQVHQVKKSKTWNCKLCGEKQSLLKVYGQGSGADCRQHVQKLNLLQGEVQQAAEKAVRFDGQEEIKEEYKPVEDTPVGTSFSQEKGNSVSRWSKYLVQHEEEREYVTQESEEKNHTYTDEELFLSQTEMALKPRKQKESVSKGCGFEDQEQIYSTNKAKRFKMCEGRGRSTSIENQHSASANQFVSGKSKWGKFLSTSPAAEINEGGTCRLANVDKEESSVSKLWQKEEETEELVEARLPIPKTRTDGTVLSKASTTSRLNTQSDLQGAWKTHGDNRSLDAHTGEHCAKQLTRFNISPSLTKTSASTNMFQTDEDFDDNY
ncbi:MRN complex-interacting protein [Spea bombifrons]|uniref:MRN complex-interacting protein n=1 Tax=Spea bombifrons TaxID=233779 RepID=UPI002348F469|nr:MRN complex-interacting protein [Spea bombifrons]